MQTLPSADCFPPPPPAKLLFHSKMASALEPLLSGCIFQACCCLCFERFLAPSPRPLDPKFRHRETYCTSPGQRIASWTKKEEEEDNDEAAPGLRPLGAS
ncbi:hypothetical protein ROHU_017468 [Labeo rohita]|uniref:Uncharacterized protein n=1 Tax=Labeo rohita TaxID=84645 RepID=A0A498NG42_LABRO|nr:hypothetical protein ROHU_017468 [Labeo rohita]